MGKFQRGLRLLVLLATLLMALFAAYNFGLIGQVYSARESEARALSAQKAYVLYFYSEDCLISNNAYEEKEAQKERFSKFDSFMWIDVDVEQKKELSFAWKKDVQLTPTLLLYDPQGQLLLQYAGKIDWTAAGAQIEKELNRLMMVQAE